MQYIYCGEATVHNDVLNEVLKGGEILKIRGLWRNAATEYLDPHQHYPRSFVPQPQPNNGHHAGTSSGREARIQIAYDRERPVVIRSQDERSLGPEPQVTTATCTSSEANLNRPPYYAPSTVYTKKTIDRDSEDCQTCRIKLRGNEGHATSEGSSRQIHPIASSSSSSERSQPLLGSNNHQFIGAPVSESFGQPPKKPFYSTKESLEPPTSSSQYHALDAPNENFLRPPRESENHLNDPMRSIKREPQEWCDEYEQKPQLADVPVKREVIYNEETQTGSGGEDNAPMFNPLSCELCKETFTVPGDWVRHIENHAETPQTVPKKRRRTEVCDDCGWNQEAGIQRIIIMILISRR